MEQYVKKYGASSLVTSLLLIVVSLFLIFKPSEFINAIMIILGIVFILDGALHLISYFSSPKEFKAFNFELAQGILEIVVGVIFVSHPSWLIAVLPFIIGIWMIYESIIKIQIAINLKENFEANWIVMLVLSILTILFGIVIVLNPIFYATLAVSVCGVGLLLSECLNAIECVFIMFKMK